MEYLIGFIGYGEAAYNISSGFRGEGLDRMIAYDAMQDDPERGPAIRNRAREVGISLAPSLEELCRSADFVFSLTSPAICVEVARQALPFMTAGQVFCDLNSADPTDMTAVSELPRPEGVKFVDVAVLGSVPKNKHRTKMYLSGDGAESFYHAFKDWNTVLKLLDAPAGGASAIKMFKSVFSKGIMQLLLETYVPAAAYGVLDQIVDLTRDTFKTRSVEDYAEENLYRTLIHAKRRSSEMEAVAKTVERLGYDASVSWATNKKLLILAEQNYKDRIGDAAPGLRETVEMVVRDTKNK